MSNSKILKTLINLVCFISFTTTFVAPELIHLAAHALSNTTHVEKVGSTEKASFQGKAQEACEFNAILAAHTGHSSLTSSQNVELNNEVSSSLPKTLYSAVLSTQIAHPYYARGPPQLIPRV